MSDSHVSDLNPLPNISYDPARAFQQNVLYSQMAAATYALSANDSLAASNPVKAKEFVSLIHECAASIALLEGGRQ